MSDNEQTMTPEEVLQKAKDQGYDPDRYSKEDSRWKTPEQFLEFGEQLNPILQENNRRLLEKNKALEVKIENIQKEVMKFAKLHEETQKEAYAKALEDLRAQRKDALASGDYDLAEEVTEKIELTKEAQKTETSVASSEAASPQVPMEIQNAYNDFLNDNKWADIQSPEYNEEMEAFALALGAVRIKQKGQPKTAEEFKEHLKNVTEKVKARFSEKFETEQVAAKVEGGGSSGSGKRSVLTGKKTYANLPKEHQESCDLLCKTIDGFTVEKYLATYKW